jgi:hypothetical protein
MSRHCNPDPSITLSFIAIIVFIVKGVSTINTYPYPLSVVKPPDKDDYLPIYHKLLTTDHKQLFSYNGLKNILS